MLPVRASRVLATALLTLFLACSRSPPAPRGSPAADDPRLRRPLRAPTVEPSHPSRAPAAVPGHRHRRRGHRRSRSPPSRRGSSRSRRPIPRSCSRSASATSVVATDSASDFPAEAATLPGRRRLRDRRRRDRSCPSRPTSSSPPVSGSRRPRPSTQLRELGIPVVVVYAPTVEAVLERHRAHRCSRRPARRGDRADRRRCARRSTRSAAPSRTPATPPRTFYDVGYDDTTGQIFAPADESFVAEMVTLAGADTITTGDPNCVRDPARAAHRGGSGGDHPRRQRLLRADTPSRSPPGPDGTS